MQVYVDWPKDDVTIPIWSDIANRLMFVPDPFYLSNNTPFAGGATEASAAVTSMK